MEMNDFIFKVFNKTGLQRLYKLAPGFPNYICVELTNACNLRCVQCLYKGGTTEHYSGSVGLMKKELAFKILKQLAPSHAGVMLNGDGESLLHPDFHEIARYACSLGLNSVYFNTNGTLLKPDFSDELVKYFKGAISISLDGFKESHERIRIGSSYDNVIANIEYLQKKIRETSAPITISVAYCNYDQPEGERDEFIKHWVDRADYVTIGEVYDKDYQIISNQLNVSSNPKRVMCGVPWETLIVRWNGLVIPCSNCFSLDNSSETVLGDANNEQLKDIWKGLAFKRLRDKTRKWQLDGTVCEKCERWHMYVLFQEETIDGVSISRSGVFTKYERMKSGASINS